MLFLLVELYGLFQICHYAVNPRADKTGFFRVIKNFLMFTFFSADNRRKQLDFCSVLPAHNRINNLVYGLFLNFASAVRTVRMTGSCKKQTVVIVNFSNRSHRRTRIFVR